MRTRLLFIAGDPLGKARPRATVVNGHARVYTPGKTAKYENLIRLLFQTSYPNVTPSNGPVLVEIVCYFMPPKSAYWPVNKKHNGELKDGWEGKLHTSKPDIDNLAKAIFDGLNGVAFKDDAQVCFLRAIKAYSAKPGVKVTISYPEDDQWTSIKSI